MKAFLALVIGFCLTLAIFAGGALTAIFFMNADPVPVQKNDMSAGSLWTNKAVKMDAGAQTFERLPARPMPQQPGSEARQPHDPSPASKPKSIDSGVTASVSVGDTPNPSISTAHIQWCSQRYRSYDPADDSYNSYSGRRHKCVSPYSERREVPELVNASAGSFLALVSTAHPDDIPGALKSQHTQSCFERYRSYRLEDNTYQPYGGPRQQCEP